VAEVKAEDEDPPEGRARQGEEAAMQSALQGRYRTGSPEDIELQDGKENSEDGSKHASSLLLREASHENAWKATGGEGRGAGRAGLVKALAGYSSKYYSARYKFTKIIDFITIPVIASLSTMGGYRAFLG
jgi:hypothetical protein